MRMDGREQRVKRSREPQSSAPWGEPGALGTQERSLEVWEGSLEEDTFCETKGTVATRRQRQQGEHRGGMTHLRVRQSK